MTSTSTYSEGTVTTYTTTDTSVVYETHTKTYTIQQTSSESGFSAEQTYQTPVYHVSKTALETSGHEGTKSTSKHEQPMLSSSAGEGQPSQGSQGSESPPQSYGGQSGSPAKPSGGEVTTTIVSTNIEVQTVVAAQSSSHNGASHHPETPPPEATSANPSPQSFGAPSPGPSPAAHGPGQGENAPMRMEANNPMESAGPMPGNAPYYNVPEGNGTASGVGIIPTGLLGTGTPVESGPATFTGGASSGRGFNGILMACSASIAALFLL